MSVRGHRVELAEVAAAVRRCPSVRDAAAALVPSGRGDDRWLACWFVPAGPDVDPRAVRAFLTGQLPAFMMPRRFYAADRLPLTRRANSTGGASAERPRRRRPSSNCC